MNNTLIHSNNNQAKGFTLVEILIVVVIISIVSVLGVQIISSGSVERNLKQHGQIFKSTLNYACDQAVLQNIPYGVKFSSKSYAFAQYVNQEWVDFYSNEVQFSKNFEDGSLLSLSIDDQEVVLRDQLSELPQLLCDNNGELSDFTLVVSDFTQEHHYQLKSVDYWKIQGEWLE